MSKLILMIAAITGSSWGSVWHLGEHGGGLTLGEISLGGHGHELPAITLGESVSEHWKLGFGSHGWDSSITIGDHGEHGGHVIPVVKEIGIPVVKEVELKVPYPEVQSVPQPYPVPVFVQKPVPYEVIKHEVKKVEKKVPVKVEKIVPYKVEKHVPFTVYKNVPVPVEKPFPIKIPVYKTIVHKSHK